MGKILLLSLDRALGQQIGEAMTGRATVDLIQSIEPAMLDGPAIILIDRAAIPPERALAAAIGAVKDSAAGRPIILATDEREADQLLAAVRAGADDILPRAAEAPEIAAILARHLTGALADHGTGGRLTLVIGTDREAAAMVAADMALSRTGQGTPTLLIDFTMPTSAAQAYLDLPVSYGLASAIADIDRLDASLIASTLARHTQSGLMLLTYDGGTGTEPVGISPATIAALIRRLRACCGDVILCAGSLRHGGLLRELAAQADCIELLCAQSIRELEASRRLLDRMGSDNAPRARLLVWDHQPGILLDSQRMTDVLGVSGALAIPIDWTRARNALNAGTPLALEADGGPYMQAIRRACGVKAAASPLDRLRKAVQRRLERAA